MNELVIWPRVRFISYAAAWVILYSYALLITDSGVQTALVGCGMILLTVSVYLFVRHIRRAQSIIGVPFATLVLVSMAFGEYVLAMLHVGAFLPLVGWMGNTKRMEAGIKASEKTV